MEAKTGCKPYPTDISDEAWEWIAPILAQRRGPGRKRTVDIREVVNALFYLDKTGCQCEMLPHDFPDYRHVNYS
jgi:transposase